MSARSKKATKVFFIITNLFVIIPYLFACLTPFLSGKDSWLIAISGLIFPFLLIIVFLFFICWLFARSKWSILSGIALLLSFQQLSVLFGLHLPKNLNIDRPAGTIRILSWNVASWDERNKEIKAGLTFRPLMMDLVENQDADILCFQEFFESHDTKYYDRNIPPFEKMGFVYHYFIPSLTWTQDFQMGVIIFSKFPIIDTSQISYGENAKGEHLIYADIKIHDKTIRVMTTHLQSVELNADDYALRNPKTVINKLKTGYGYKSAQSQIVEKYISESPYPVVFCGDILDVPNSYTYFTMKGNLQDAFLKKGSGLGRTMRFISPTLRIDYIFADKKFKVQQYDCLHVPYSDHYPIIADLDIDNL